MKIFLLACTLSFALSYSDAFLGNRRDELVCPEPSEVGICVEMCNNDSDCAGPGELCCSNGCGHECAPGVPESESENECELECEDGFTCVDYRPICWGQDGCPAETLQTCVPDDYFGCAVVDCMPGFVCYLQEVTCVMEPCYPVPECGLED